MYLDLKEVPFSTRGSYIAVSYHEKNFRGSGMEEGLYLRTVHGNAKNALCGGNIAFAGR